MPDCPPVFPTNPPRKITQSATYIDNEHTDKMQRCFAFKGGLNWNKSEKGTETDKERRDENCQHGGNSGDFLLKKQESGV